MATPVETAQIVRIAFGLLSGENGHHSFEDLCRQVAKRRIASNVLPATGPVSAGGDQGRDFETFRTYLAEELPFALGFLALASQDVVIFACTIQRDKLKAKFEGDIKAICTQGTRVDRIYIFAAAEVPVRLRHDLEVWAQDQYEVGLEIIDGLALAEFLAEPDLYWVAQQYLRLPAELAPDRVNQPDEAGLPAWYVELREYWQDPVRAPSNLGDMFDLRHGLRHAIPPGPARGDLDGWLTLMTRLAEQSPDVEVRLHAVYEITAARIRGKADLRPAEPLIRRFMSEIELSDDPSILFDGSVLVQFCTTAAVLNRTDISLSEVIAWIPHVRRHVDEILEEDLGANARAGLLQVSAHLALHVDYSDAEVRGSVTLAEIDQQYDALMDAIAQGGLQQHLNAAPLVDLDGGMRRLLELSELLPDAPAYPIDTFSTVVDLLAPSLRDHPLYRQVCDGLDDAVKRQEGDAAVGDKCRQRATALKKAGRLLDALREFHQAKVNWFHGDTLYGALRAMANIVDIYCALGMYLAAKKYALAMAVFARGSQDPSDREFVPMALFAAANQDHLAGAWIASADLASIASLAHAAYAPDAANLDRHAYVSEAAAYQVNTALAARQVRPDFEPALWEILDQGHLGALVRRGVEEFAARVSRTEQEWLDWLSDKAGAPFSDVGPERTIAFRALGVLWTIHGRNEQDTVLAMEDFASTLQILLVEFASLDPVIIPQDVDIEIRAYPTDRQPADTYLTRVDGDRRLWLLFLPAEPQDDVDNEAHMRQDVVHLAFQVLLGNSLLGQESFSRLMDRATRNGLFHNLEIGRPYRELARFRTRPIPPLAESRNIPLADRDRRNPRAGSAQLDARSGPGPGYNVEKAQSILAERYDLLPVPIRLTLPELLQDERVRTLFQDLREEGWKDWHLLTVVMNLTVNLQVEARHEAITAESVGRLADAVFDESKREERPDDPRISTSEVTREVMLNRIRMVAMSSLRRWDLTLHHGDTYADPVMKVLEHRYGFWADDIPHSDPFHGLLTTAA
ncbi:Uncharacterised protein [Amycolatopsis camponoti]|uniref:Uncharacterized protein n=1 Tax=Amycolatopsis camponoti TaxID=2606593 RepID=A0A6I8LWT9_9PSEU|nr:hypothetical protein [Amycolatopsis camponoti]VVJ19619.1 Uncharacterised protein [Amycolatopsis camponoti]